MSLTQVTRVLFSLVFIYSKVSILHEEACSPGNKQCPKVTDNQNVQQKNNPHNTRGTRNTGDTVKHETLNEQITIETQPCIYTRGGGEDNTAQVITIRETRQVQTKKEMTGSESSTRHTRSRVTAVNKIWFGVSAPSQQSCGEDLSPQVREPSQ